jgi:hypothetical protein
MKTCVFNGTNLCLRNHCDNPTFHLNLETSEVISKKQKALELSFYFESKKTHQIQSKIVSTYILNKTGLIWLQAL